MKVTGMLRKRTEDSGFTVVELVIAVSVLAVVALGAVGALQYAAGSTTQTSQRELALGVANEQLEKIRNLNYDDIGTVNGYPTGDIPNSSTVGIYTVEVYIGWSMDAETGLSTSKNIRVTVRWSTPSPGKVTIESNIAGKSGIANAGDVRINVLDADTNEPIKGALVKIKPLSGTQSSMLTNGDGYAFWGKVPAGTVTITATKTGYFIDTAPLAGASIAPNQLNEWTLLAAKPSTGLITVRDQFGNPVANSPVKITKSPFTATVNTDGEGLARFDDLGKGTYTVTSTGPTGYSNGSGTLGVITSGATYSTTLTVTKYARLIVTVRDDQGTKVSGATVSVTGPGSVTPASAATDTDGMSVHVLGAAGTYTASVSKAGYISNSGAASVAAGADGNLTVTIDRLLPTTFIVRVVDQNGAVVPGATVSATGPGSVTPASGTSDASGYITFSVGQPGDYTATASKAGYVSNAVASGNIANGGSVTKTVAIEKITGGWMSVKYTSNTSGKTVYIYQDVSGTPVRLSDTLYFTARNQTLVAGPYPAGTYYVSTKSTYSTSAKSLVITDGNTTSVSLSSSN